MTNNKIKKQGIANPSPLTRQAGAQSPPWRDLAGCGEVGKSEAETYTDIVTTYLKNNDIPFCRKGADQPLFILFETGTINIYCLFDITPRAVMHWSLVSWAVPEPRKARIADLLTNINSGLKKGMFYVDEQTGCVAFSRTYIQQSQGTAPDRESLEHFCRDVLEAMPQHHDTIWNVAFGGKNKAGVANGHRKEKVRVKSI